jgi:hypothetical protein
MNQRIKAAEQKPAEEDDKLFRFISEEDQELLACEAWKEHIFNNRSIIVDLF